MRGQIFRRLRDDHRRVLRRLEAFEPSLRPPPVGGAAAARRTARVRQLVDLLGRQFDSHMAAEDSVLFPALARRLDGGQALIAPLREEHEELQAMLAALIATLARPASADRDEQIRIQLRDLTDLLRIHIRKEEALVFGIAERVLDRDELEDLAARRLPEGGRRKPDPLPPPPKGIS